MEGAQGGPKKGDASPFFLIFFFMDCVFREDVVETTFETSRTLIQMHFGASHTCLARLLKHDLPVHGLLTNSARVRNCICNQSRQWTHGTPDPGPPQGPQKVRKVQSIVQINYFGDFSDFFSDLFGGSEVGGSRTPFGRLFWDLLGFRSVDGRGDPKTPNFGNRTRFLETRSGVFACGQGALNCPTIFEQNWSTASDNAESGFLVVLLGVSKGGFL